MANVRKLTDADRATASGELLRLCYDAHFGRINQQDAFDRIERVAGTVVKLIEDGVLPTPAWWAKARLDPAPVLTRPHKTKAPATKKAPAAPPTHKRTRKK